MGGCSPSVLDDLKLRLFDLSPGMVEAAGRVLKDAKRWTDFDVAVADSEHLLLRDGCIDTVLAVHKLYHLRDPAAGIKEMRRVLKDIGTLVVVLNPAGTMAELSLLINEALGRQSSNKREPLTSEQALPLLQKTFSDIECRKFPMSWW